MSTKKLPMALPIYFTAAAWVLGAFVLKYYKLWDLVLMTIVSALVYVVSTILLADKSQTVEVLSVSRTGSAEADKIIAQGKAYIDKLKKLNDKIEDGKISAQISQMERSCMKIFDFISKNPKNARQITTFMEYYLPAAIHLLNTYDELKSSETQNSANISSSLARIDKVMDTMVKAFEKQYDDLFADKTLDIMTDINVLETELEINGLK